MAPRPHRADEGPLSREALAERTGTEGQATPHLLGLAALRGRIVLVEEREIALGELARRYLAGHAPAVARALECDAADVERFLAA